MVQLIKWMKNFISLAIKKCKLKKKGFALKLIVQCYITLAR
jgi:hypothetical protein